MGKSVAVGTQAAGGVVLRLNRCLYERPPVFYLQIMLRQTIFTCRDEAVERGAVQVVYRARSHCVYGCLVFFNRSCLLRVHKCIQLCFPQVTLFSFFFFKSCIILARGAPY